MPDTNPGSTGSGRRLGVLIVGLGGAVATTAVAGIEMIRRGSNDFAGLPLASSDAQGLAAYRNIEFAGWDLNGDDLSTAAAEHHVLERDQAELVDGANKIVTGSHRGAVDRIREDIRRYKESSGVQDVVVINLASVERWPADISPLVDIAAFERGLDENHASISPAMLYAYGAITEGVPYGNFTPSLAADIPALTALADQRNVPVAGKDGKTGQTFLKTVLAPAFKARSLFVEGWFSTNILGNRDGLALDNPASLQSKLNTKGSVLDSILGYKVEDHLVNIQYYKPRGDNKEAWDNIDIVGFLGQKMQIKLNFLCRDSILAAPLVIEIARVLDLARRRGDGGIQEQLGIFFKAPMTEAGKREEHSFPVQQQVLLDWLAAA